MNFLAHIFLSGESEGITIGNFIGDAVKGNDYEKFPPEIIKGILLHRKIDQFTDSHPVFNLTKARLRPKYAKYSGVIGDIFYDHFLAVHWQNYHNKPLSVFSAEFYALIESNIKIMPLKVQEFFPYMKKGHWLENYSRIDGIKITLEGMSKRAKFNSGMENSINELVNDYDLYEKEFFNFFPSVQEFVNSYIG